MKILYFMHVDWDWIKQRPHFLAEELSRRNPVYVWFDKSYKKKTSTKNSADIVQGKKPKAFYRIPKDYKYSFIFWLNSCFRRIVIRMEQLFHGVDTLYLTYPTMVAAVPRSFKGKIVYDCMDDHIALASNTAKNYTARWEKEMLRRADLVLFSSLHLQKTVQLRNSELKLNDQIVRNGFTRFKGKQQEEPVQNRQSNELSICYFGTIGTWFDWEAVLHALQEHKGLQVHIIGPKSCPQTPEHPRMKFYGAVDREQLQAMAAQMDVLVMPFLVEDIVLSVDPVKLYEYIAIGKNIIAPFYPEIERFAPFVNFYRSTEEFSECIGKLMENNTLKYSKKEQENFLDESTWAKRAEQIEKAAEDDYTGGAR